MKKFLARKDFLALFSIQVGLIAWATYLVYEPSPLEYTNLPFQTTELLYHPGDTIQFHVERELRTKKAQTFLVSSEIVNLETQERTLVLSTPFTLQPGHTAGESHLNKAPMTMEDGRYRLEGFTTVQGTINSAQVPWSTNEFLIRRSK